MPRQDLLGENQRLIYDMLNSLLEIGDNWDTARAFAEWVNDHFYPEDFSVIGPGDDQELQDVVLGWQ